MNYDARVIATVTENALLVVLDGSLTKISVFDIKVKSEFHWNIPLRLAKCRQVQMEYKGHVVVTHCGRGHGKYHILFDPDRRKQSGTLQFTDRRICTFKYFFLFFGGDRAVAHCLDRYVIVYDVRGLFKTSGPPSHMTLKLKKMKALKFVSQSIIVMTNTGDVIAVENRVEFVVFRQSNLYKEETVDGGDWKQVSRGAICCCFWDVAYQRILCRGGGLLEIKCGKITTSCMNKNFVVFRHKKLSRFLTDPEGNLINLVGGGKKVLAAIEVYRPRN
jgi:hypothetical protein